MSENQTSQKTKEEWLEQGIAHLKAQRYREALRACEYASQLDTACARAYHGMGLILTQLGDYGKALVAYEQACQLDPDNAKIAFDMGEFYFVLKNYGRACIHYKRAIQLDRKYERFYLARVQSLVDNSWVIQPYEYYEYNEKAAISVFNKVLLLDPDNTQARSFFTELERRKPKYERVTNSEPAYKEVWFSGCIGAANCRCVNCWEP